MCASAVHVTDFDISSLSFDIKLIVNRSNAGDVCAMMLFLIKANQKAITGSVQTGTIRWAPRSTPDLAPCPFSQSPYPCPLPLPLIPYPLLLPLFPCPLVTAPFPLSLALAPCPSELAPLGRWPWHRWTLHPAIRACELSPWPLALAPTVCMGIDPRCLVVMGPKWHLFSLQIGLLSGALGRSLLACLLPVG